MLRTLEVKNVKSFVGREGYGYNASLYYKGKRVAFVIDDASGGCIDCQWQDSAAEAEIMQLVKDLPEQDFEGMMIKPNLDIIIGELVDAYENSKRTHRLRKDHVLFRHNGKEYKIKHLGNPGRTIEAMRAKYPGMEVI
jgi:hypothetical protein